jgi:hypothetical protein
MLYLEIPGGEYFNDNTQEFSYDDPVTLTMEHSLLSLSKWESIWNKPFMTTDEKTIEETISYAQCMTINKVSDDVWSRFTQRQANIMQEYIEANKSATTFHEPDAKKGPSREIVTTELIYYWMVAYQIPFEAEKWHLSRLMALIRIAGIKNQKEKKMSKKDVMSRNAALNRARRAKAGTNG